MSRLDDALEVHRALLERWRGAMNLVGPGPTAPHFDDARVAVADLNATGRWADLGSGAGFPGIALAAAWPEAEVWLVESRERRCVFLDQVIAAAKLDNARVMRTRVEDLAPGFHGVISRAYKPPLAYLSDAARLLAPGGRAALLTGDEALGALDGWEPLDERRYVLDGSVRWRRVLRRT